MEKRILEKRTRNYIIATLDNPTQYLKLFNGQYMFVENIDAASLASNKTTARWMVEDYYTTIGKTFDLVVLPIEISYELINEYADEG